MAVRSNLRGKFLIGGAAVLIVAAIFITLNIRGVWGNGRAERIDHWRLATVAGAIIVANCAFQVSGSAPTTLAEARELLKQNRANLRGTPCYLREDADNGALRGHLEYERLSPARIRVCNTFLRADLDPPMSNDPGYPDVIYADGPFGFAELNIPRSTHGRFCYEADLPTEAS